MADSQPPPSATQEPQETPQISKEEAEARAVNQDKFELELEFVQSLANPYYLNTLAQQGILNQPTFVNYLKYLQYWKDPSYAKFIRYPHCLHHLDLLQHEKFRVMMASEDWKSYLQNVQYEHWRTWRDPRLNGEAGSATETAVAAAPNPATTSQ